MNKLFAFAAICCALAACGDDSTGSPRRAPYAADKTTVIGGESFFDTDGGGSSAGSSGTSGSTDGDGTGVLMGSTLDTPNGSTCLMLDDECITPQEQCGDDGTADVLLDEKGKPATIICYPHDGVAIEDFEGPVQDIGNNVVLVIDDQADGVDVEGDVTIDGNNVTLYGYGPDVSVIGGDLHIDKNNSVVRGVRVQGDATITKNNGTLIDCVVEGDLTISANNVNVALCEIWGKLTIEGNNAVLVANAFSENPVVTGKPRACNRNVLFSDANDDDDFTSDEITGDATCDGVKKP